MRLAQCLRVMCGSITLFVFGALSNCGPEECYSYAPIGFSTDEITSMKNGTNRFNRFIEVKRFELDTDAQCHVVKHEFPLVENADGNDVPLDDGRDKRFLREIWLDTRLPAGPRMEAIFMHELGHAAGMGHTPPDQTAIMQYNCNSYDWTLADRDNCEIDGVCRFSKESREH